MAITENTDFPRLTPPGDRMPDGGRLFRRPEELTDEQFDLLAAAWSEDALTGEALEELEAVFSVSNERRNRAESFRHVRLSPLSESWPGMHSSLKQAPGMTALRRTIVPALLAIAAMVILIINGPAGAKLKPINSGETAGVPSMAVAEIAASSPIMAVKQSSSVIRPAPEVAAVARDAAFSRETVILTEDVRVMPLALAYGGEMPPSVAPVKNPVMTAISIRDIQIPQTIQEDRNWMLRSISFLASAVTGKEQSIDGYIIASGAVNGLNTILGWEMELEQVNNRKGETVAVNFSSSLLSFTKPLNKSTP